MRRRREGQIVLVLFNLRTKETARRVSYLEVVVLSSLLILNGPLSLDEFGPELVGLFDERRVGRRTFRGKVVDLRGKGTLEDWQDLKGGAERPRQ